MAAIVIYKNLDDRRLQRQNAAERAAEWRKAGAAAHGNQEKNGRAVVAALFLIAAGKGKKKGITGQLRTYEVNVIYM